MFCLAGIHRAVAYSIGTTPPFISADCLLRPIERGHLLAKDKSKNTQRLAIRSPRSCHGDIGVPLAAAESRETVDFQPGREVATRTSLGGHDQRIRLRAQF
jgi:hypothetical protein